jgi:hypothetical protein
MGVDTIERLADSAQPTNLHARSPHFLQADGRDPIVMQAIKNVTQRQVGADWWSHRQNEITQAIYDEIRRLDREPAETVALAGMESSQIRQMEVITG